MDLVSVQAKLAKGRLAWVQDQFTWGRLDVCSDSGTNRLRFRTKSVGLDLFYVQNLLT